MTEEDEELRLGEQVLTTSYLGEMELDTFYAIYEGAVTRIDDTSDLGQVHEEVQAVMDLAGERAEETLAAHGIEMEADVRYSPELRGGRWADDGVVEVGRPGRVDHPYRLGTEITHELLHGYAEAHREADRYTAREEGLMQTWNLYHDDLIQDSEERESYLEDVRRVYNDHNLMPEGFGDEIYEYARHFVAMYDNADGDGQERMESVLETGMDLL
ncbi:MAG: hypothetical protein SVU32_02575 [Candidatus Nanohaloarchaea archaeon]|nr:hypothetical protein [Candidatus Nanohaloarchaea archaeon]